MKHFYFLLLSIFFSLSIQAQQLPFITTWEVTVGDLDITIPTYGTGYNYTIDFGDGTVQNNVTGDVTYTYNVPGIYTVTISGDFPRIRFGNFYNPSPTHPFNPMLLKIKSVEQWGGIEWASMEGAFSGCESLIINATDAPDLSQVTDLSGMFTGAYSLNQSINHWDVSNVADMAGMFNGAHAFNQPLNNWNVSNVTNMSSMFSNTFFNQPLNNWNVSNVTDMSSMFNGTFFNQPLDNWDVSSVTNMQGMLSTNSFNQPLNNWDVSNVTNMSWMFFGASIFNQPLNNWDVSNVTDMRSMFSNTSSFNQPLNNWDVSNVTNMSWMFSQASFNQPLNNWDVSNVTIMSNMFHFTSDFNQPLNNWNVSNVVEMRYMFHNAQSFNQPLDNWNVSNVTDMGWMFTLASLFNQPLNSWNVSNVVDMLYMFYGANAFNQPLDNWDVSNVTTMGYMFTQASSFNQPLNNWDVSSVTAMGFMFQDASSFNQPLNNWDVTNVENFSRMFHNAHSFNQDLSSWQMINMGVGGGWPFPNPGLYNFLSNSGMDSHNYDTFLNHLVTFGINSLLLGADNLEYCSSGARDYLINQLGWTISGDILSTSCNLISGDILYDQNNNGCDTNDINVHGFMINANDGTNDWIAYSSNGNYNLGVYGTNFTVSVVNHPSYFTVTPASVPVTFTTSSTAVVDFCVTSTQTIEDLNVTIIPTSQARPGFDADYRIVVRNVGTETIASVNVTLEFDDLMQQFVSATPAPGTTTANTLTFSVGTMQPFQKFEADITMLTFPPPTVEGGDILNFTAEVTPVANDHTPNDNTYDLAQIVINSYDPNDKQVLQGEELHIDDIDEYLDYLIRFQNTGTASAINVRILDTLHPKLDWSTLIPISASHDYYVTITDGNRVEFMFDNIHLPDSLSNEPDSHGFVAYKIKPKSDVQVGDVISGDAAIYFDFNAPIITNMVQTEIVDPLSITDVSNPLSQVVLYPNPTNKTLNIHLTEGLELEEVLIYDLQGKEVQKIHGKETMVDVENLRPGMYLLKITTNRGTINRQLIKN